MVTLQFMGCPMHVLEYFTTYDRAFGHPLFSLVTTTCVSVETALESGMLTTQAPTQLTFVTWNIDGLDQKNLKRRTRAVIETLNNVGADIVFLQEVIPETFSYLESKLTNYDCYAAKQENYFVATLLRRGRVYYDKHKVIDYPTTRMYRHLLAVRAHCGNVVMDLLNTHLESTTEHAQERMKQLEQCLDIMNRRPSNSTVIFAGKLNTGYPQNTFYTFNRMRHVQRT